MHPSLTLQMVLKVSYPALKILIHNFSRTFDVHTVSWNAYRTSYTARLLLSNVEIESPGSSIQSFGFLEAVTVCKRGELLLRKLFGCQCSGFTNTILKKRRRRLFILKKKCVTMYYPIRIPLEKIDQYPSGASQWVVWFYHKLIFDINLFLTTLRKWRATQNKLSKIIS